MKKYIATGGAGFIRSALAHGLFSRGAETVEIIDNLPIGSEEDLEEVASESSVLPVEAICSINSGVDTVLHLAAIPSVTWSIYDPAPSHGSKIDGTFNVLHAAVDGKVRKVVYAVSSSAYGDTGFRLSVEAPPKNPKSPYAVQRLMSEYYCSTSSAYYGLDATSLRLPNVHGPRQDLSSANSGLLSLFVQCIIERHPPTIDGDRQQTRDFNDTEDVVELLRKTPVAAADSGNVLNAGNGRRHSLNEASDRLQEIKGVKIPAVYGPPRARALRDWQADTTVGAHGDCPQYTLVEGLRRTLAWYKKKRISGAAPVAATVTP